MTTERVHLTAHPKLDQPRMILSLSGWMDGGDVSTGTVETLVKKLNCRRLAEVHNEDSYILSFPGDMEISALFRPFCRIEDGLVHSFHGPSNQLFYNERENLILWIGKEPNLHWDWFADDVFSIAKRFEVSTIYFIGSVAGTVPHTREPRIFCSVSDASLKKQLEPYRMRWSNYEGPASVVTYMTALAAERGIAMVNLVAEIPAYVQGVNFRCIEAVIKQLAGMLKFEVHLDDLRLVGDELENRLSQIVEEHPQLAENIEKMEEAYDNDIFDTEMGDLKEWLHKHGLRLD